MTALTLAAVLAAAVAGGAVQATLGFGGSFIAVPVLAVLLPGTVPVSMLVGLLPLTVLVTVRSRADLDRAAFVRISVARLPGIVLGTVVVAVAPTAALTLLVAVVLLFGVAAMSAGWDVPRTPTNERLVGALAGFTGTAAALGGPPMALLYRQAGGADRRATLSAVFSVGIVVALVLFALSGQVTAEQLRVGALVGVGQLVGVAVAEPIVRRAGDEALRRAVLVWAAVGAVTAGARSVVG